LNTACSKMQCVVMNCATNETITETPVSSAQCPVGYSKNPLDRRLYEFEQRMNMAQHVLEFPKQAAKMAKAAQNTANRAADAHLNIVDAVSNGAENAAPTVEINAQRFWEWVSYVPVQMAIAVNGFCGLLLLWQYCKFSKMLAEHRELKKKNTEMLAFRSVMDWIRPQIHLLDGEHEEEIEILKNLYEVILTPNQNRKVSCLRNSVRNQIGIAFMNQGFNPQLALDPRDVKPPPEMVEKVLTTFKQSFLQKHCALQKMKMKKQKIAMVSQ